MGGGYLCYAPPPRLSKRFRLRLPKEVEIYMTAKFPSRLLPWNFVAGVIFSRDRARSITKIVHGVVLPTYPHNYAVYYREKWREK